METVSAKLTAAAVMGVVASYIGEIWVFVAFTFFATMLDYITGLLAGRANEGLNSKRAVKGLYKKLGIFMLLSLGLFLDGAVNHFMTESIHILEMPFNLPIAHIVTMWIVITEAISICENLERLDVPIPKWMVKMLRKAEKEIDKDTGEGDDK